MPDHTGPFRGDTLGTFTKLDDGAQIGLLKTLDVPAPNASSFKCA